MNKRIFLIIIMFFQIGKANAANYPPVVRIESPKNYSNFKVKEEITFKGKATDLEDGDLSGETLIWTSDMDGRIGYGNSFSVVLSQGFHIVILTATDSENSVARASIFITVGIPSEPISEVEKPKEKKPESKKSKIETPKLEEQGIPSIVFLFVPPFGSFKDLQGQILNADPNKFAVAVYIMKNGVWWSKPAVKVTKDGKWTCDITTAENDELAIKITAYLIPIDYQPPLASGEFWILKEIEEKCLAKIEVTRKIRSSSEVEKETSKKLVTAGKSIDTSEQKLAELQILLAQTKRQEKKLKVQLSQLNDQEERLKQLEESLKKDEQRVKEILDQAELLDKELVKEVVEVQAKIYQFQKETKELKEGAKKDKERVINSIEEVLKIRKKILQELKKRKETEND